MIFAISSPRLPRYSPQIAMDSSVSVGVHLRRIRKVECHDPLFFGIQQLQEYQALGLVLALKVALCASNNGME